MSEIFSHDCDQGDCDSCSGTVAHKDGQPCDCSCHEDGALCEYCGDNPVDRAVQMRDATPTDRGDWVQTYTMSLCKKCADELERPISL